MDHPLSESDIFQILGKDCCEVKIYDDLENMDMNNFYNILLSGKALILLYPIDSDVSGHWICIFKYPNSDTIEFFDPLGKMKKKELIVDTELTWTPIGRTKKPILTQFLKQYKGHLEFNPYQFQDQTDDNVSTCGRWCILRYLCRELNGVDDFKNFIEWSARKCNVSRFDELVTALIN
jgi:hypothetical protein